MKNSVIIGGLLLLTVLLLGGRTSGNKQYDAPSVRMQAEVNDYDLIIKDNPDNLAYAVKTAMKKGWQPVGGVAEGSFKMGVSGVATPQFMQAMVKYK